MIKFKKFDKSQRSSFGYWFWHWLAYNLTAIHLKHWKFKYFFHDIEKPWLKLFLKDYAKVQNIHRKNNKHHLAYKNKDKIDWEGLVIDWECSRLTKIDSPRTAREMYEYSVTTKLAEGKISDDMVLRMKKNIPQILEKLKL